MIQMIRIRSAVAASLLVFLPSAAMANLGDLQGFGSRTAALGGAGVAWGSGAFAAYSNPAELGAQRDKRLQLSWGLAFDRPMFTPIHNVVIENKAISDKDRTGDVDTGYRDTLGQEVGATLVLFPEFHNITFGTAIFFPLDQLAYLDTGEAYVPEYVMYRARTQRPQVQLGLGGKIADRWHVGVGASLAFSLTGNAFVFLQTNNAKASTMRFAASIKPKLAP
ncbi:MAG TPA: hypothetical protein VL588_08945, partial [Bdellovibrionota bacterium]|nr:hypothetical protein [Bdellovibrionota bacterium]